MRSSLALSFLAAGALAFPHDRQVLGPAVTIQNGTLIGYSNNSIDIFKGIPFAQPPVGNLRLRPPQSITQSYGTLQLTNTSNACPQFGFQQVDIPPAILQAIIASGIFTTNSNQSEDCLTIDVFRPEGTAAGANLPVLFWIFGGGWELGATGQTDGSKLVQASVDMGAPMIFVQVNYRLGAFGWLGGKELAADHSTNLGLRDQRLGLEWTAENICEFGGDPDRVVIWGESAGSYNVFDQMMVNQGDNTYNGKPLFHGAIMQSGTVWPTLDVTCNKAQTIYDNVVFNAGCANASSTLDCLRSVPYDAFHNASNMEPGSLSYRSEDGPFKPRPDPGDNFFSLSPDVSIRSGRYPKIPVIIGDQMDEGTLFSLSMQNLTTDALFKSYLATWYPDTPGIQHLVDTLIDFYPDNITGGQPAGSPYNTGSANNFYPEFKRVAAVIGDLSFILVSRVYRATVSAISPQVPIYTYLANFDYGTPLLGNYHAGELPYIFGQNPPNEVTNTFQSYYVSFVNYLDPNALAAKEGQIEWPKWTRENPQALQINATDNFVIPDTYREAPFRFLEKTLGLWKI